MSTNKNTQNKTAKVSQGSRQSSMKTAAMRDSAQRQIDIQRAWLRGENPWLTVANPNKNETAKPFVRVRANEKMGDPRNRTGFIIP